MMPLEGITVVDLSRYIAGPYCAQLLGDLGADVVKVEPPGGEFVRTTAPQEKGENLYFMVMNRNKKGITLNTRTEKGKQILTELFKTADVVVQNFRVGTLEKMGFTWEALHRLNPRLILVSISAFGPKGPMAKLPGYDVLAQALGGIMDKTGAPDGPPYASGTFLMDYGTGIYGALGATAALQARDKTGEGQHVDLSLLQTALSYQIDAIPWYYTQGKWRSRQGNDDPYAAPVSCYLSKDEKYVSILAGADAFFPIIMRLVGKPEYIDDPRFKSSPDRMQHKEMLTALVAEWAARHNRDEIVDILQEAGVPVAPVLNVPEMLEMPQIKENGFIVDVPYTGLGDIPQQGFAMHLSQTPMEIRRGAPRVGEHNQEVLAGLGYTAEDLERLKKEGVI